MKHLRPIFSPLTKAQALAQGYTWYDQEPSEAIQSTYVPEDALWELASSEHSEREGEAPIAAKLAASEGATRAPIIDKEILNSVVSQKSYRIIPQELAFYRTMNVPIPRLHPDERYRARIERQNPYQLWSRTCARCGSAFETTYGPDRPELIYCESCYKDFVY